MTSTTDLPRSLLQRLDVQAGVASRAQLLDAGLSDNDVRRLVRQRKLRRIHPGVYVNHTGPPSWTSRAWAGLLFYGDAALCGQSALRLAGDPIHVAIEHPRNAVERPGLVLHRLGRLDERVQWHRSPPRLRLEEAALDVAGQAGTAAAAIAVVTDVCNRRATTPQRLLDALDQRQRTPRGIELRRALHDVAQGAHSVLEVDLVRRVLRPHGLPVGRRQVREATAYGVVYRDLLLDELGLVIELDGHAWHADPSARARDMARDLVAAGQGLLTIRLGWPHVHQATCETAAGLGDVMVRRGWRGRARACTSGCVVGAPAGAGVRSGPRRTLPG
jgi:very-short-patch-repair endonuclease